MASTGLVLQYIVLVIFICSFSLFNFYKTSLLRYITLLYCTRKILSNEKEYGNDEGIQVLEIVVRYCNQLVVSIMRNDIILNLSVIIL